ncbi:hypothetical protein [Actinomadura sediminis]|uniref:CdiI immunity protein domain-containing protein n=1 Tax=Actinomadura sediminis TaxID=1038904 RepID=A0ABW3F0U8_9ACTN
MTSQPNDSPDLVRRLLDMVVTFTWFFDTCDESVVDDDMAVKQLEQIGHAMHQLPAADKLRLVEELATMAASSTAPEYREYLEKFAHTVGLAEPED